MNLQLDVAEASLLRQVLIDYTSDLRLEIADTDQADLRGALKEKDATLDRLIGRLTSLIGSAT